MSVVGAVECRGFRNLAAARTPLGADVVVVHGPNGAGKTNLLEAVYFGLTGRSFRAGDDRDLIRYGDQRARVELELEGGGDAAGRPRPLRRAQAPALRQGPVRRSRGAPAGERLPPGPAGARQGLPLPIAGPIWTVSAVRSGPRVRTCGGASAAPSRSATPWSRRVRAGLGGAESLASWDERLAAEAEPLIAARADAVDALAEPFSELGVRLGLDGAEVSYRPRAAGDATELATELARRRAEDLGRAYTSYGPTARTRSSCVSGAGQLRRFASQGQQRLALLALLFAERAALLEAGAIGTADAARRRDE